jgi:hypothetical protein
MKKIKNITVVTGTYTNKEGQEKKRYMTIGSLFEDNGNFKIKIDSMPLAEGGWNGWANCYDIEERTDKPRKLGFDDMPNDIPF